MAQVLRFGALSIHNANIATRPFQTANFARPSSRKFARRCVRVQAKQQDDLPPSEMTYQNALDLLGVREGATFDDILRAKKRITDPGTADQELLLRVEAAYDILLMQSLSRRRSGEVVDSSVRFADVQKPRPPAPPSWLQKALKSSPVAVTTPNTSTSSGSQALAVQSAVFASLLIWTYASGLSSGSDLGGSLYGPAATGGDVPGLQLALAFGWALYSLRKEGVGMGKALGLSTGGLVLGAVVDSLVYPGKAAGLSTGGLVLGAVVGSLVQAWLRVDIFPLLGIGSPAVLISEFSIINLWLAAVFLR
ncbi:unnamed protein product [Closterium sp. NIES-64]|nr:unnamed protein product [Closterium sp. NIES-64]